MSQITEEFKEKIEALSCDQLAGVLAILGNSYNYSSTVYDIADVLDANPRLNNPDPIVFDKEPSKLTRTITGDKFLHVKHVFYRKCLDAETKSLIVWGEKRWAR